MNIYEVMDNHPFWTWAIIYLLVSLISWPFKIVQGLIRHANIKKAGWPPEYLDADGDTHHKENDNQ
jgi:hypothetical protein